MLVSHRSRACARILPVLLPVFRCAMESPRWCSRRACYLRSQFDSIAWWPTLQESPIWKCKNHWMLLSCAADVLVSFEKTCHCQQGHVWSVYLNSRVWRHISTQCAGVVFYDRLLHVRSKTLLRLSDHKTSALASVAQKWNSITWWHNHVISKDGKEVTQNISNTNTPSEHIMSYCITTWALLIQYRLHQFPYSTQCYF